ncbi:MAG TPA: ABC transporter substrate-binding protein [Stellaceae bacterium]|nr:ABC transporter substrate-binding protein [Stellaceae bacterium]
MTTRGPSLGLATAAGMLALLAGAPQSRAAGSYDIQVVMPLTGGGSFLGHGEQQSLQLAEKTANEAGGINGTQLHFVFHDDQTSPQTAVQLTNQVMVSHPAVMIGSSIVAMCSAMAPLVAANGPVQYCLSPGVHPAKGSYTFTSSVSTLDLANALIRYFRLKGWTRIALMFSTDASGQDAERGIKSVLDLPENKAMKIVETAHFATTDVNVSAQLENVKAANPQAFIAWSTGAAIATIFRGMIQAGLDVPTATTDGNMTRAQMTQYEAFLPKQLYFPAAEWVVANDPKFPMEPAVAARQKAFYAAFKSAGLQPDIASELAWDPALILVDVLKQLGINASARQIRDRLGSLKGFAGINGIYDFQREPQRGLNVSNAVVTRWDAAAKNWRVVSKATGVPLSP